MNKKKQTKNNYDDADDDDGAGGGGDDDDNNNFVLIVKAGKEMEKLPSRDLTWPASLPLVSFVVVCQS